MNIEKRVLMTLVAVGAILGGLFVSPASATQSAPQASVHQQAMQVTESQAPFGQCDFIKWQRKSATTVRIYAFSDDLKTYFPPDDPYGLLWITIHDADLNLKYEGTHNVSRYRQFDQTFTAHRGWRISVSLTDDENTRTLCAGGAWV